MEKLLISGGARLSGDVCVSGMKNDALPLLFASLLVPGTCVFQNVPMLSDVSDTLAILEKLGAAVTPLDAHTVAINCEKLSPIPMIGDECARMRASSYLLGALTGRFYTAEVAMPGGCDFGARPIDYHLAGFRAFGDEVTERENTVRIARTRFRGGKIRLPRPSVGATVNMILASCVGDGCMTEIHGAAREPHVCDLCAFLNRCGAEIYGAGSDLIAIIAVPSLHGCVHRVIPDMIEAGTFLAFSAVTASPVTLYGSAPEHLGAPISVLRKMGAKIKVKHGVITTAYPKKLTPIPIIAAPYPKFPTDLQPQFCALFATLDGHASVKETVFANRFRYVGELAKMGASITVEGDTAAVCGRPLHGADVRAVDLRAGGALVTAALAADGKTEIGEAYRLERGYEDLAGKLRALGVRAETQSDDTALCLSDKSATEKSGKGKL